MREVAVPARRETLPADLRFERAVHRLEKVVAMGLSVEADEVRAEESVQNLDRPVVLGIALLAALAVGVFNFIADVLVMYLDPRTRLAIA